MIGFPVCMGVGAAHNGMGHTFSERKSMSKRHVRELLHIMGLILDDATDVYPTLAGDFAKDRERLRNLVGNRGIGAICIDLPAACKHLDRCLDAGEYKLSGLPTTGRVSKRIVIPKLFRGLYLLVFDEVGRLKEDYDVEAIFFLRQLMLVGKKVALNCSDRAVFDTVENFLVTDSLLPEPEGFWSETNPSIEEVARIYTGFHRSDLYASRIDSWVVSPQLQRELSVFLTNLDSVSRIVTSTLGAYSPSEWKFRHGPGAISERTGTFNKYCWTNWSERLENVFPIADYGFHSYSSWADTASLERIGSLEPVSRLISVPKTMAGPRLIAAEPASNQWCQQNLWHYFSTQVKNSWIDQFVRFRDQRLNQELCRRGSEDGSLLTADLSEASDRVTCHFVGQLFRVNPRLVLALQSTRTRFIDTSLARLGWKVELRKFATMGSACTFPVQSLGFLSICLAVVLTKNGQKADLRNIRALQGKVAVFGDDLIVPSDCRELLYEALEILDFKVNFHKSFGTGRFRESCGLDAFAGISVTPAYWHAPCNGTPESIASTIEVRNGFHSRFLLRTARYLETTMPSLQQVARVDMDSGVCGLRSFARADPPRITRWNHRLQRTEVRVLRLTARVPKRPITDDSALLQYFTEAPSPWTKWSGGVRQRAQTKKRLGWVPIEELGFGRIL